MPFPSQFNVIATDIGSPVQTSETPAVVRINVQRNLNAPIFVDEPYAANLDFNAPAGSPIISVTANDADTVVSSSHRHYHHHEAFCFVQTSSNAVCPMLFVLCKKSTFSSSNKLVLYLNSFTNQFVFFLLLSLYYSFNDSPHYSTLHIGCSS